MILANELVVYLLFLVQIMRIAQGARSILVAVANYTTTFRCIKVPIHLSIIQVVLYLNQPLDPLGPRTPTHVRGGKADRHYSRWPIGTQRFLEILFRSPVTFPCPVVLSIFPNSVNTLHNRAYTIEDSLWMVVFVLKSRITPSLSIRRAVERFSRLSPPGARSSSTVLGRKGYFGGIAVSRVDNLI